jgi:hypothetical protein
MEEFLLEVYWFQCLRRGRRQVIEVHIFGYIDSYLVGREDGLACSRSAAF